MKLSHVFRVFVVLALFVVQVVQAEQITPVQSEVAADNALLLNELISARSTSDKKNLINLTPKPTSSWYMPSATRMVIRLHLLSMAKNWVLLAAEKSGKLVLIMNCARYCVAC